MTKSTITRERLQELAAGQSGFNLRTATHEESHELARMALAAMDSSESVELPLDYLQGHKDGLEWAAQLAEANHPETGDWLYDDPIELAKAIRKGPDMPPVQPVADSEPVIVVGDDGGDALSYRRLIQSFEPGTKLYRHAQPAPAVPGKWIPVSERMPENDGAYLCWDNRYVTTYAFIFGAWQANQFVAKNITHWMPLPNPPKE
ncbi:Eaa1 [Klebsiella pneumoniae]|nr:Eaa1 [Klebsiella pneumoniae]